MGRELVHRAETASPVFNYPPSPKSLAELGIPGSLIVDLVLRFLREHDSATLSLLRKSLKLPYTFVEGVYRHLRDQQFLWVKGVIGGDLEFALTNAGRSLAAERSSSCRYAGPAPVPLAQYAAVVHSQRNEIVPTLDRLREAFRDLVVGDDLIKQLSSALISGRPVLLYGPSGNGKTSIIERLSRVYQDYVLVLYAILVDTHIILVFDPLVHRPIDFETDEQIDTRWVLCRRPCVWTAGELLPSMSHLRQGWPTRLLSPRCYGNSRCPCEIQC